MKNGVGKDRLYIGANYHPHDWPAERWPVDLRQMREAGFNVIRLGHLCWDSFDPACKARLWCIAAAVGARFFPAASLRR